MTKHGTRTRARRGRARAHVMVPAKIAPVSAPAASALFFSMPEFSTSRCWMSGVIPSIDMVNIDSRPMVIVEPRARELQPNSLMNLAGVPSVDPPKRCCWIMHSSQIEHGMPDASPPRNAPPTMVSFDPVPIAARNFWKKPVVPNCTAFVPPRLRQAIGSPRYTTRGFNEMGRPCCTVFFQTRNG